MTWRIDDMITAAGKAASRDVADREHDASVGEPQRVVPIAAKLLAIAGGDVDPVERNARNLGQRNRQGGALKLRGDLAFAFVEPRVLDRDGGAFGQLFEERQVVVAVAARRLGPKRNQRTDRPAAVRNGIVTAERGASSRIVRAADWEPRTVRRAPR